MSRPIVVRPRSRVLAWTLVVSVLAACGGSDDPTAPPEPAVPTSVQLSTGAVALASLGASEQLTATVLDQNGSPMAGEVVAWTTSDAAVATVSSTGLVTSVADGAATITATSGTLSVSATVTVEQVPGSVTLAPTPLVLAGPGALATLTATVVDASGTEMVDAVVLEWASDDTTVAVVDSTGSVTAVAAGSTVLTATVSGGSAIEGAADVTVNPALEITTATLPNAVPTVAYAEVLAATGGDGTQTWAVTAGMLPAGLSLDGATGAITGVPTGTTQTFTVGATSGDTQTDEAELTITVNPVLGVTTATLTDGDRNVAYSASLAASGGAGAYTWTLVSGALPRGLTLASDGTISGTPVGGETLDFTARVASDDGQSDERALSLTINGPALLLADEFCSEYPSDAVATFADSGLEGVVRNALALGPSDDITCTGLAGITSLNAQLTGVTDLSGAQNLVGVTNLNLFQNQIADLSPLSTLTGLTILTLTDNPASDVSPLSGLVNLDELRLGGMGITDLTPLSGLTVLTVLWLEGNLFTDISPLSTLTTLEEIFLFTTPITDISALQNLTALTNVQLMDVGGLSDIQPLIDNAGLGAGDTVNLENVSPSLPCADVTALQGKGVTVSFTVCAS